MCSERISAVYQILNLETGESYVGGTRNVKGRWKKHRSMLRANNHCNKKLQLAWNKFGESSFEVRVLQVCDKECMREFEKSWIARLDSCSRGYNSTPLGAGPDYATREKIGARSRAGLANTAGLVRDARSEEGRARRSATMCRLNETGTMRFKKVFR